MLTVIFQFVRWVFEKFAVGVLIVGLGVVIDAFLVRAIVVPGVVTLLGRRESRGVASAR